MKYIVQVSKVDKKEQLWPATESIARLISQFTRKMSFLEVLIALEEGKIVETPYSQYYLSQLERVK